ncbi:unnamed protein product, partial [Vitis vinifera]|uniref:Uncharacterized protein n=1 Tax=Vitis vinifera TaxID=29760 RepID=D7U810_VITVI
MTSCPHLRTIETSHGFGHEFENQRASSDILPYILLISVQCSAGPT